jgi:hypothetical protein
MVRYRCFIQWPFPSSVTVFLLLFVVTPSLRSEKPQTRSVIDVSMVSLKNPATDAAKKSVVENKAPKIEKPEAVEKPSVTPPVKKAASVADTPPKPKTSLKKKTFKSTQVVKQAIEQLEKQLDDQTRVKTETAPAGTTGIRIGATAARGGQG